MRRQYEFPFGINIVQFSIFFQFSILTQISSNTLYLQSLEASGDLNKTLLILMSDHGARYSHVRATVQGKLEERLPYFSFRFPPWFEQVHPDVVNNVKTNTHRLTTSFDIHETFMEILNFTGTNLAEFTRINQNSPEFTRIYQNLRGAR